MRTQLIDGHFSSKDALDLIAQMIHVKLKYHESKVSCASSEEDIKAREKRIKDLQRDLYDIRQYVAQTGRDGICIRADIEFTLPKEAVMTLAPNT